MPEPIPGVHHVTAIASDPGRNHEFYTGTLGLRLVKQSVNQDDVSVYHLFYADHDGSPGTSMTFFPYTDARPGQVGTGQVSTTQFVIPEDAVAYWTDRFDELGVDADDPEERFGDQIVRFRDPDGLPLELVARPDAPEPNLPDRSVPEEHAIRGFFGVSLTLQSAGPTVALLDRMGFEETASERDRTRYESHGELGAVVDILEDPQAPRGVPGAGTVHHVAFQVTEETQEDWRDVVREHGLRPTEVIDRKWFRSVYARTQGGVLFEWATKEPGYTVDEPLEELGETLVLPEWLEPRRDEIEAGLPPLEVAEDAEADD